MYIQESGKGTNGWPASIVLSLVWMDQQGRACLQSFQKAAEGTERFSMILTCVLLTVSVKYERIKFLVIALKNSVEVYAWAPKPYHKFMAFKVITTSVLKNSISHAHCDQEPGNKSADHLFKTALLEGGQQAKESKLKYMCMSVIPWASLVAQLGKNPPTVQETPIQFLGWEDPLEKGTATHSTILAWSIPWTIYTVHWVTKSWTRLSDFHFQFFISSRQLPGTSVQQRTN